MNRSSCASGSGNVPSCSIGFCVAITRNGAGSGVRDAVDRDLPLGHRLEQRRLRLRRRPVDLVDEQDVGEDRAGAELEVARLLVVDREPGDVGRLQVGRALDARSRSRPRSSAAIARASMVFAVPGTSSSRTWPSHGEGGEDKRRPLRASRGRPSRRCRASVARARSPRPAGSTRPRAAPRRSWAHARRGFSRNPVAPRARAGAGSHRGVVRQGVTVTDVVMPRSTWNGTSQTPV